MNLSDYQIAAFRTCPDLSKPYQEHIPVDMIIPLSMKLNLSHMVEGMNSELSEIYDSRDSINEAEEYADIMWYVGGYCTWRNYNLGFLLSSEPGQIKTISWHIQELTDGVKKYVAYNKPIDTKIEVNHICSIVWLIQAQLGESRFRKALQNNIDKLRARYPEKFTEEAAINRNLEAERKELEK